MKANELRNKSTDELHAELLAILKEQFSLRMQRGSTDQPVQGHLFRNARRNIARIKTLLREKEGLVS